MKFDLHVRMLKIPKLMEANTRSIELRELIAQYDHEYYVLCLNPCTITDAGYDALYQELQALESQYPELIVPHSPTQRIGGIAAGGFAKVAHTTKMLSLDNLRTAEDVVKAFAPGEELLVEPKVDGLSLKLVYEEGKLVSAVTRGNGTTGDDVTASARAIRTVPLVLTEPMDLEVFGEVYMTYAAFNKLNAALLQQDEEPMANARNAAAGALKLKDPKEVAQRRLSFVAYGSHTVIQGVDTQLKLTETLEVLGFVSTCMLPTVRECKAVTGVVTLKDEAHVKSLLKELDDLRALLDVQTDGLVFKVNDLAQQRELGAGNKYPNWAYAFKYPPERKVTTLLDVTIQIGKTGKVTPVAELKPVLLSGTTVQRASLCNQDEIKRLNANIGDEIFVEKAAEIIPNVVGVAVKNTDSFFRLPERCPCCETKLERPDGMVDYFCTNPNCEEKVQARLLYALSREALDLQGSGKAMVQALMANGVRKLSKIFTVSKEELSFLKPAARKKFLEQREIVKTRPLWRQLSALCIEGLGVTLAQRLDETYHSLSAMRDAWPQVEQHVGKSVYNNMVFWFTAEDNADEVDRLQEAGLTFVSEGVINGPLSGKTFVITGALASGQRKEVEERIRKAGGNTKSSVTRKVNFLVQGVGGGRKKAEAVEKLGVTVISEEQLYELIGEPMPTVDMSHLEALREE